jgi:S-adenosylmethionine decarboxylase proenzyme
MDSAQPPVLYTADLSDCHILAELPADSVMAAFVEALTGAGATVVQTACHVFPGMGLTCVLVLAESHAVLHTWPETGTVNLDIFSCSPRLRSLAAIKAIGRALGAADVSIEEIPRANGHAARTACR